MTKLTSIINTIINIIYKLYLFTRKLFTNLLSTVKNTIASVLEYLETSRFKDAFYYFIICSFSYIMAIASISIFCGLFIYDLPLVLNQWPNVTIGLTLGFIEYLPVAMAQKYVLLWPDITGWGVAYAMCFASFKEAPFTMTSFIVIIATTITFAHNTIKGVLIRLRIKHPNYWYIVIATILLVVSIIFLCMCWDIIPINSVSYCAGEIDPTPKPTWMQYFSFQPSNPHITAQQAQGSG